MFKNMGVWGSPTDFFFLFHFHLRQVSDLWRLFCRKNDQITEVLLQFLNPRCSAALKKADPIVDKLDPKFRQILKFLDIFFKFQGLPEFAVQLVYYGIRFFVARLRLGTASWIKEVKITIVN